MENVVGLLVGQLIGVAIGSLIGAIILRAAAHWVAKMDVPFGHAYVTIFLCGVVNVLLGFVVGFTVGATTGSIEAVNTASLIMLPIGFLLQSAIIGARLQISYGQACLIGLVMIAIGIAVALVILVPIFLVSTFAS